MERRYSAAAGVRLEKRADGKGQGLTGHASVFYRADEAGTEYELWSYSGERCVERVMPGAFSRAIKEGDCRSLFNHDASLVLGRQSAGTLRLSQDGRGLLYDLDLPDTAAARDLATLVGRGDVTGASFTFRAQQQTWRQQREGDGYLIVRELNDVDLFDCGPVTFPAYGSASSGMRSAGAIEEARKAYEAWKEARGKTGPPLGALLAGYRARALSVNPR